jgi:hypothetical protein
MLSAAFLSGSANLRMYGCEAFFSMESLAKFSTRTAGRLLLTCLGNACRLSTVADGACLTQRDR